MPHDLRTFWRERLDIPLFGISPGVVDLLDRPVGGKTIVGQPCQDRLCAAPSLPRPQPMGELGGSWGGAEGFNGAQIASLPEPAAVAVAPSNSDFKVLRREYFIGSWGLCGLARDY